MCVDDGLEVGEITLGDLDDAARAETGASGVNSALVAIDRDHPAARGDALEERGRDPAGAEGGVDGDLPGPGLQALYEGCEKDRPVASAVRRQGTGRGVVESPHAGHERQGDGHWSRRIRLGRSRRGRRCGRAALVDQVPDLGELVGAQVRLL